MAIVPTIFAEFLAALHAAPTRRIRAECLRQYAQRFGVTIAQLRRQAKASGFDFGYARRRDAGMARRADLEAACRQAVKLITASGGRMPSYVAIDRAKAIGWIEGTLKLSTAYVDRYIREHAIRRCPETAPRDTRLCKWGDPGEVMQIDSTNCAQWFFLEESGQIRFTRRGEVYRNKPARVGEHILRYVASDPASGCFRVRYYQVAGEKAETALEFLYWAMMRTAHPDKLPMAGVPQRIVLDGGSGNKSAAFKNACTMLGVEHCPHVAHHPWAKGSVETTMNLWQEFFESELAIWPAKNLDELNTRAYGANVKFCAQRIHSRHGLSRSQFYAQRCIALRMPPAWEVFLEGAHTTPRTRIVSGGQLISVDGNDYYVGALAGCGTGDSVTVVKAILDWTDHEKPLRISFGEQTVVEKALAKDERGNYVDERLYQVRNDEQIAAEAQAPVLALSSARETAAPAYDVAAAPSVSVPAARMMIARTVSGPSYRRLAAKVELVNRIGRELSELEAAGLAWGETVTRGQIEDAIKRLLPPDAEIRRQAEIA